MDQYVRTYESLIERLRSALYVEAVSRERGDRDRLLVALHAGVSALGRVGLATSLIRDDLAQARAEAGPAHAADSERLFTAVLRRMPEIAAQHQSSADAEQVSMNVLLMARDVLDLLQAALSPANSLRASYLDELDRRAAKVKRPTPKQRDRRLRDQRIVELSRENKTTSPPQLMKLAASDLVLSEVLRRKQVELTPDIIRNVLRARRRRGNP